MNSIMAIHPYKDEGTWVFDDERAGLVKEPFVAGADLVIDRMVENLADAARGFTMLFSAAPFPGHQIELRRLRAEFGGNWYACPDYGIEGWLCPALFKYFDAAPGKLYALAKPRGAKG